MTVASVMFSFHAGLLTLRTSARFPARATQGPARR